MSRPPPYDALFVQPLTVDEGHGHWRRFTPALAGHLRTSGDLYVAEADSRNVTPLDKLVPPGEWPVETLLMEADRPGRGVLAAVRVVFERGPTNRWAPAMLRGPSRQFRVAVESGALRLAGGPGEAGVRCETNLGDGRYDAWWGMDGDRVRSLVVDLEGLSTTRWSEWRTPVVALKVGAHVAAGELGCTLTRDARFRARMLPSSQAVAVWLKGRVHTPELVFEASEGVVPSDRDDVLAPGDSRGERFVCLTAKSPLPADARLVLRVRGPLEPLTAAHVARATS